MAKKDSYAYKLGIVIPVFNSEKYLKKCLDSIFQQIDNDILVCCINDNSTDSSYRILESYKSNKNFILINNRGAIHGPSIARNVGISETINKCEFLTFIDSDDYVDPNYIENILKVKEAGCDIACFSFFFTHADFSKKFAWLPNDGVYDAGSTTKYLLEGKRILSQCWGKIYKSNLWDDIRFPEDYIIYEDYATLYKVFLKANKILIDNYSGYHYWLDNGSTLRSSMSNRKIIKGIEASLVPYFDNHLSFDLKMASMQFAISNYLMLLPRVDKKTLSIDESKQLKTFKTIFTKNIVRKYVPLTKKEHKKKLIFLLSKHLYIYIYKYIISKRNK